MSRLGYQREQADFRFTYEFVQGIITDSTLIEIEISGEDSSKFDIDQLNADLKAYDEFKTKFQSLIDELEKEIFEKQS